MNNKWEIKQTDDWKEAEKLADEGWELVSVVKYIFEDYKGYNNTKTIYYFKRLKK